jgi:hypothetical protein
LLASLCTSVTLPDLGAAPESTSLKESFDLVGALPEGWQTVFNDDSAPNFYEPEVVAPDGGANYLKLQSGKSPGGAPFRQPGVINTEAKFQDLTGSVLVRFPREALDRAGVMIRAQEAAYSQSGYVVTLRTSHLTEEGGAKPGDPVFMLGISDAAEKATRSIRGWVNLGAENFAPDTDYELRFTAKGDVVTAEVWTTGDNPYELGRVTVSDTRYGESGYVGLRLSTGNSNSPVFFRNLVVESAGE